MIEDNIEGTIKHYQRELELEPDSIGLYKRLSDCYIKKREYNKAESILQNALTLDPDNIGIYSNLFSVYMVQRKYSSALACLMTINKLRYRTASSEHNFEAVKREIDADYAVIQRIRKKIEAKDDSLCAILNR
ncbi:hypothetical protein KY342_03485 [Candidatus Woesearchaeota archaeon]|nr:hypothetical protein [Candidatus Woesearchaeota archaeon]